MNDSAEFVDDAPGIMLHVEDGWLLFERLGSLQAELRQALLAADVGLEDMVDEDGGICPNGVWFEGAPSKVAMVLNACLATREICFTLICDKREYFDWVVVLPGAGTESGDNGDTSVTEWPPTAIRPGEPSAMAWPVITLEACTAGAELKAVLCLDRGLFIKLSTRGFGLRKIPCSSRPHGRMRPVAYMVTGCFAEIRDSITDWLLRFHWPFILNSETDERADWHVMLPAREVRC